MHRKFPRRMTQTFWGENCSQLSAQPERGQWTRPSRARCGQRMWAQTSGPRLWPSLKAVAASGDSCTGKLCTWACTTWRIIQKWAVYWGEAPDAGIVLSCSGTEWEDLWGPAVRKRELWTVIEFLWWPFSSALKTCNFQIFKCFEKSASYLWILSETQKILCYSDLVKA